MDLRRVIFTLPWLRRVWRVLPGPLRLPLLVIAAVVWFVRRRSEQSSADRRDG